MRSGPAQAKSTATAFGVLIRINCWGIPLAQLLLLALSTHFVQFIPAFSWLHACIVMPALQDCVDKAGAGKGPRPCMSTQRQAAVGMED